MGADLKQLRRKEAEIVFAKQAAHDGRGLRRA